MHFVYHPHHKPVIVHPEEYQKYLDDGWYDTPAKFPANLAAEGKPEEEQPQEQVDAQPRKKGRPPKAKPEEVQENIEL